MWRVHALFQELGHVSFSSGPETSTQPNTGPEFNLVVWWNLFLFLLIDYFVQICLGPSRLCNANINFGPSNMRTRKLEQTAFIRMLVSVWPSLTRRDIGRETGNGRHRVIRAIWETMGEGEGGTQLIGILRAKNGPENSWKIEGSQRKGVHSLVLWPHFIKTGLIWHHLQNWYSWISALFYQNHITTRSLGFFAQNMLTTALVS